MTYNDCFGCLVRSRKALDHCQGRGFFIRHGHDPDDFHCDSFEKEIIIRGLYGAQIAWWFQFFKPHQFLFISFLDFVKVNNFINN